MGSINVGQQVRIAEEGTYLGCQGIVVRVTDGWQIRVRITVAERFTALKGDVATFAVENVR